MPNQRSRFLSVVIGLLAIAGLVAWWAYRPGEDPVIPGDSPPAQTEPISNDLFAQAVQAVAATEEADFERARELWQELIEALPEDSDIRINQAVALLKWIDTIDKTLASNDADLDAAQRDRLLQDVESAYKYAQQATAELAGLPEFDYRVPLIRSAILSSRAARSQAKGDYDAELKQRQQAAEIIAAGVARYQSDASGDPAAQYGMPMLAASFDETLTIMGGSVPQLESRRGDILYAGWKADQRNLYLLKRAAEALLDAQDARLKELLQPSIDMTRPMWSMHQALIDRLKPTELVDKVAAAIDQGQWNQVNQLRRWLNIVLSMPSFNADNRRVNPDPLVLLDTEFLLRIAPQQDSRVAREQPQFNARAAQQQADAVLWYDHNFDLHYEVVAAEGKTLSFFSVDDSKLSPVSSVQLPLEASGLLAADLFEVLTPESLKLPSSVAELMLAKSTAQAAPMEDGSERIGSRHETLQEIIAWGDTGICIVSADEASGYQFSLLEAETGLEMLQGILHISCADIESDGDLDLLICTSGGMKLMQNNGNRTFEDVTQYSQLPPADSRVTIAVACDIDRDMDQDFLLLVDGRPALLENLQHSQFRFRAFTSPQWQSVQNATGLDFGDFDGNSSWDVVVTGASSTDCTFTTSPRPGQFAARRSATSPAGGNEVCTADINNDGLEDLVIASDEGIAVALGTLSMAELEMQSITKQPSSCLSLIDRDYDGALELLALVSGEPTIFSVSAPLVGNYVDVRLAGINDGNGGGRINHYGIGSTLQLWADQNLHSRVVKSPVSHIGIGDASPENLRVIFTNGLTQNVEQVTSNTLVEEIQLLRGSCPYVYGWDGERFQLITDLLWNAPLGLQTERGRTLPDRRWEYLLLPGEHVRERNGQIELRITEELWEVAYFDHVALTAIDHPSSLRVFTNEKVGPPSIAQPAIFTAQRQLHPRSAVDAHGSGWTDRLSADDGQFAQPFRRQICQGLAEPHFIELDFGSLPVDEPLRLFLTGWMYPTDTSLNIGISQDPTRNLPEPPSLWTVDAEGSWRCVKPSMGFPGGKTKSIVIDLAEVFASEDHRIRIGSSQQIYWDEAFVSWDSDSRQVTQQPLGLRVAQLHYRGFSQPLPRQSDQPHWFDYESVSTAPNWPELDGPFTRFGDVTDLLRRDDDAMVVMTSGDELMLQFSLPKTDLPSGWRRDYVLHSVGWDKDADINTLSGQGSLPLPFKTQTAYPAPPEQADQADAVWRLNADSLTRQRQTTPAAQVN